MNMWASTYCEDCFTCAECGRRVCEYRPYCEHQRVCDSCFPTGCADCIATLEAEGAIT